MPHLFPTGSFRARACLLLAMFLLIPQVAVVIAAVVVVVDAASPPADSLFEWLDWDQDVCDEIRLRTRVVVVYVLVVQISATGRVARAHQTLLYRLQYVRNVD